MPAARAVRVATQLCEFLQAADAFERTLDGRQFNLLLHGDLKPRNIRVLDGDEIKVFDFGIAKALSLSRKVTRNDFGSIAYLSPERLESGEIDAQAELWAVGVLLYEMVSGVQPFRAADTRRLEQRIRARLPPATLDGGCPAGTAGDRRQAARAERGRPLPSAAAIRDDLQRFAAGEPVLAREEAGPRRRSTRRRRGGRTAVRQPHSTGGHAADRSRSKRRRQPRSASQPAAAPVAGHRAIAPSRSRTSRDAGFGTFVRRALTVHRDRHGAERNPHLHRRRRAGRERAVGIGGVMQMWNQYADLTEPQPEPGVRPLERALTRQSMLLASARSRAIAPPARRSTSANGGRPATRSASPLGAEPLGLAAPGGACAIAKATCGGSTARRASKANRRPRRSEALTAAVAAFRAGGRAAAELARSVSRSDADLHRDGRHRAGRRRAGAGRAVRLHRRQSRLGAARRGLPDARRESSARARNWNR